MTPVENDVHPANLFASHILFKSLGIDGMVKEEDTPRHDGARLQSVKVPLPAAVSSRCISWCMQVKMSLEVTYNHDRSDLIGKNFQGI